MGAQGTSEDQPRGFSRDLQASQSAGRGPVCGPWPAHSGGRREVINNPRRVRPGLASPTSAASPGVTTAGGQQVAGELRGALT